MVHPFPGTKPQKIADATPISPSQFTVKLNKVAKMKTGPPHNEAKMLAAMTTQPQVMIQKLSSEEIQSLTPSV